MKGDCEFCGRWGDLERHHLIGGTGNRQLSEKYGLVAMCCRDCHRLCHENTDMYKMSHQLGELMFIAKEHSTREEFIKVFGKNYLEEENGKRT